LPSGADGPSEPGEVLDSGLVTRLHDEVYARLQHGRLVLIGGPGAGKTGAMILLLLEALLYREQVPDAERAGVPAPVWLTMGSWDPSEQGQALREWVTETIGRDHEYLRARDFGPDAVARLFDTGRIALFLDGLDEMPDALRGEALNRLTAEAARRRVVITSRPEEFRGTLDAGRHLPYTAVVELRPVDHQAAAEDLLEDRYGDTQEDWRSGANYLLANPKGVLAGTLTTPLTLSLARSAYAADNPRGLLTYERATEQALRVHLLEQVLVAAYPDPPKRGHVTSWLGWLAHHMNTQPSGPTRDMLWWQIPGWIRRWQGGLVGGLVGVLIGGLVGVLIGGLVGGLISGLAGWLEVGLGSVVVGGGVGLVSGLMSGLGVRAVAPRLMTIRRPTSVPQRFARRFEKEEPRLGGGSLSGACLRSE
jgi:hypothetical protein